MTQSFDDRIRTEDETVVRLKKEMAAIRLRFVAGVAELLKEQYPKLAREEIRNANEVALALGSEGVAAIKRGVEGLVAQATAIAEEHVGKAKIWWDMDPTLAPKAGYGSAENLYLSGGVQPHAVDAAVRTAIGQLATVLEPYGFLKRGVAHNAYFAWRGMQPVSSGARGTPAYPGTFEWPAELRALMGSYVQKHAEAMRSLERRRKVEEEKRQAQAVDLWDSA